MLLTGPEDAIQIRSKCTPAAEIPQKAMTPFRMICHVWPAGGADTEPWADQVEGSEA